MVYLQQFDPLKFDAKHALKIMFFRLWCFIKAVSEAFFSHLSLRVVLEMNFFSEYAILSKLWSGIDDIKSIIFISQILQ